MSNVWIIWHNTGFLFTGICSLTVQIQRPLYAIDAHHLFKSFSMTCLYYKQYILEGPIKSRPRSTMACFNIKHDVLSVWEFQLYDTSFHILEKPVFDIKHDCLICRPVYRAQKCRLWPYANNCTEIMNKLHIWIYICKHATNFLI